MILYTADLHFGHKNVIGFDHRPFYDRDEMDLALIQLWNNRVAPDDEVYIIGDFMYRSDKEASWYLQRLRGHKHLVMGNHDTLLVQDEKAMAYFESVDLMRYVVDGDKNICLCHFPIAEWNKMMYGSYHIYGHIHSKKEETYQFMRTRERAYNAGCMINGYAPVSFRELEVNNLRFHEME